MPAQSHWPDSELLVGSMKDATSQALKRDSLLEHNIDSRQSELNEQPLHDIHVEPFSTLLSGVEQSKSPDNGMFSRGGTTTQQDQAPCSREPETYQFYGNANNTPLYNDSGAAATAGSWMPLNTYQLGASHSSTTPQVAVHGVGSRQADTKIETTHLDQVEKDIKMEAQSLGQTAVDMSIPAASAQNVDPTVVQAAPQSIVTPTAGVSSSVLMPPPPAPASMLGNLRPSERARPNTSWINEPSIIARLVSPTVTLFRRGKTDKARILGQFALDCMGQMAWDESLAEYMSFAPTSDDEYWVDLLLREAVILLRRDNPEECGFLDGILHIMG